MLVLEYISYKCNIEGHSFRNHPHLLSFVNHTFIITIDESEHLLNFFQLSFRRAPWQIAYFYYFRLTLI